ncbi:putative transporter -like protein [Hapsidospora chrysogenum ATCC 11550]|uniref:Putative transporter-like protein n=1 Tax=Hapsidospora chrysogenum (strain ATCC 11550 / CBS 779.69 / DSM 880 / IAM 14645 / JCM 23072 / IMI 49137) TaxID=857340 RepID=A0A086T1Q7_HAPC1|nr:putative transporter -like protein [Hapsidospora chrysogenum ATCC 11550]
MEKPVVVVESDTCDQQSSNQALEEAGSGADSPIQREPVPLMELERSLVGWESLTDPMNPSPLGSSVVAPSIALTLEEFKETSLMLGSFMVTIYVLGFAIGPLFLGPLSEIYGRRPVVVLSTWFFNAWVLGSALAPTMPGLIVMRLLAGIGGSAVLTIPPAIIADLYPVEKRGFANSLIVFVQSLGPAVGPICGGFIAQYLGWRWSYWVLLIAAGSVTVLMSIYMPESYAPRILHKKAQRLQKETGRTDLHSQLSLNLDTKTILARSIARPAKMLISSPIVILICAYVATVYGFLYLMFTTIPTVFGEAYGWPTSLAGLAYTPLGLGMLMALCILMKTNDATLIKLTKKNNHVYERKPDHDPKIRTSDEMACNTPAEMRLPATIYYAAFVPVSLFWYGWSVEKKAHWYAPLPTHSKEARRTQELTSVCGTHHRAVPIVGLVPYGFGMIGIFMPCQTYLVDVFPKYAASAVATSRASLSIMGAFLPLAGPPLYESLGVGYGNTVLGALALVMTPIPLLLYK